MPGLSPSRPIARRNILVTIDDRKNSSMTTILIAGCDLDSPVGSPSLNGSSLLSLENHRSSRQWNSLQFKYSCQVSKIVLDYFCQTGTNEVSTFRGCLQLTAFPFRSQDCEEILPGCNFRPSGSFYRALHLSEFCSVLFSCVMFLGRLSVLLKDMPSAAAGTKQQTLHDTGVDDDCY